MIHIDGSHGEGGGQIVRTALALATLSGQAVRITGIRAGRPQPGLKAQHLSAIRALQQICRAECNEVNTGAQTLIFRPGLVRSGAYDIDIGTAGSIALLLQALLPPLLFAGGPVTLHLRGGTSGKWQAPVEYNQLVLWPYLQRFAKRLHLEIRRTGYYPKGGGEVECTVVPRFEHWQAAATELLPYELVHRPAGGYIEGISHAAAALQAHHVAERQSESAAAVLRAAGWKDLRLRTRYFQSRNPGSGITLAAVFPSQDQSREQRLGADALGERGKPAEEVGAEAARRLLASLTTPAPVDEYLADQLIPFLGLLPGSRMRVPVRTGHLDSNCYVVEQLLPVRYSVSDSLIVESRRH